MGSSDADVAAALSSPIRSKRTTTLGSGSKSAERPQHPCGSPTRFAGGDGSHHRAVPEIRRRDEVCHRGGKMYGSANTAVRVKATIPQKEAFDWRWPGYDQVDDDASRR